MGTTSIPSPENRWQGPNRGGWSNAEFDRLSGAFTNAIAQAERVRYIAQMSRAFTEDLPSIPIQFDLITMAHAPSLTGLRNVAQEAAIAWNIEEWDFR
jgi:peptide/nickel transport system substrate-binding protein